MFGLSGEIPFVASSISSTWDIVLSCNKGIPIGRWSSQVVVAYVIQQGSVRPGPRGSELVSQADLKILYRDPK